MLTDVVTRIKHWIDRHINGTIWVTINTSRGHSQRIAVTGQVCDSGGVKMLNSVYYESAGDLPEMFYSWQFFKTKESKEAVWSRPHVVRMFPGDTIKLDKNLQVKLW